MLNYSLPKPVPPTEDLYQVAVWLKALAEPNRLKIIHYLMEGVQCNCELGDVLEMAPNLISHHLRVLREIGLVKIERDNQDSRWVYYSVNTDTLEEIAHTFNTFFDPARIKPRRLTCGPRNETVHRNSAEENP